MFQTVAAQRHHITAREHGFETEDMIRCHAVFQAMGTSRIERHIAADRADLLTGGIRSVVQPVSRRLVADHQVDRPRLHDRDSFDRDSFSSRRFSVFPAEAAAVGLGPTAGPPRQRLQNCERTNKKLEKVEHFNFGSIKT